MSKSKYKVHSSKFNQLFPCMINGYMVEFATTSRVPELQDLVRKNLLFNSSHHNLSAEDIPSLIKNTYIFLIIDPQNNDICGVFQFAYFSLKQIKYNLLVHHADTLNVNIKDIPQEDITRIDDHFNSIKAKSLMNIGYEILPQYRNRGLLKCINPILAQLEKIIHNSIWFAMLDTRDENYNIQLAAFRSMSRYDNFKPARDINDDTHNEDLIILLKAIAKYCVERSFEELQFFCKYVPSFQTIHQH